MWVRQSGCRDAEQESNGYQRMHTEGLNAHEAIDQDKDGPLQRRELLGIYKEVPSYHYSGAD